MLIFLVFGGYGLLGRDCWRDRWKSNNRLNRKGLIERISAFPAVGHYYVSERGAKLRDEI